MVVQGIGPIIDVSVLHGNFWPEDESIEEFLEILYEWRGHTRTDPRHEPSRRHRRVLFLFKNYPIGKRYYSELAECVPLSSFVTLAELVR